MRNFHIFLCLFLAAGTAASAGDQCKMSPKLTGPCFTVHGRLSIANGTLNYRIWPVGTHRMLAVVDGSDVFDEQAGPPLPADARGMLNGFETDVFGDYEVCPLTRSIPGHMQHVCVVTASKLMAQPRDKKMPPAPPSR